MVNFEMDPDLVPGLKLGLHSFQIILSFVAWCLMIIVLNDKKASVNGNLGWSFAVCFISVPGWIYLVMTPRWQRTRRFAEPHAMFAVDAVFAIIWLSSFASLAQFNSMNKCGSSCNISKGAVAMGVIIFLLFLGSTFVSIYTLKHYKFHGMLPGYDKRPLGGTSASHNNHDPDKTAFSMGPDGDEPYARVDLEDPDHDLHADHLAHVNDGHTGYAGASSLDSRYGGGGSALDSDLSAGYSSTSYPARGPTPLYEDSRYSPRPDEPGHNSRISSPALQYAHPPPGESPYDNADVARFPAANYGA